MISFVPYYRTVTLPSPLSVWIKSIRLESSKTIRKCHNMMSENQAMIILSVFHD